MSGNRRTSDDSKSSLPKDLPIGCPRCDYEPIVVMPDKTVFCPNCGAEWSEK